ncbi:hypothetical protein LguiB_021157 [Lonicera macranthoides]
MGLPPPSLNTAPESVPIIVTIPNFKVACGYCPSLSPLGNGRPDPSFLLFKESANERATIQCSFMFEEMCIRTAVNSWFRWWRAVPVVFVVLGAIEENCSGGGVCTSGLASGRGDGGGGHSSVLASGVSDGGGVSRSGLASSAGLLVPQGCDRGVAMVWK